jgi:hypothetical protein
MEEGANRVVHVTTPAGSELARTDSSPVRGTHDLDSSTNRRTTLTFLLGGLLLAAGTPLYLSLAHSNVRPYLLQPAIFAVQSVPYVLAAGLWLPWRSPQARRAGRVLASVLFLIDVLLYVPMLTGLWPTGGDMVALGFFLITIVTTSSILLVSLVAFGVLWYRQRRVRA